MNWHDHFMNLAMMVANKSKDPSTKVGAVIVDQGNRIISTGFNGFARGVADNAERLADRAFKYPATLHAELNAVIFAQRDLTNHRIYVWPMEPCAHCTAALIQAGITEIYTRTPTEDQLERWGESFEIARRMREDPGVNLELFYWW